MFRRLPAEKARDQMLLSNVRSLAFSAGNLLNMSRLESGRYAIEPKKTILRSILKESLERLQILYERKKLKVKLDVPEQLFAVKADPEALALVVTNLLNNAIKYTPSEGEVTLGLYRDGDRIRVYCQDSGIGISPAEQKNIFSGYHRTEEGKIAAKGFGVGLMLAREIAEAHGSVLEVQSQLGQGSTFSFTLPIWDESESSAPAILETAGAPIGDQLFAGRVAAPGTPGDQRNNL